MDMSLYYKFNSFISVNNLGEKMRLGKDIIKAEKWYTQDLSINFIVDDI